MNEKNVFAALKEMRDASNGYAKKRKFKQSIDLLVSLRDFDVKKESVDTFVVLPHKVKEKKICFFLEGEMKSSKFDVVPRAMFSGFDKKKAKALSKEYDFFGAAVPVMPSIVSTFGKVFGPRGKIPNPAAGAIIARADEKSLEETADKLQKTVRLKAKGEASIKISVGKEDMQDKQVAENVMAVYNALVSRLPKENKNIKNIALKFTMDKPFKIKLT